jgi:AcrR family transcriptional regulator
MRLATAGGYHGVSPSRTSKAAGVPASRFKRHFADTDDAFLTTLLRAADDVFGGFRGAGQCATRGWAALLCEQVAALSESVAEDPDLAGLVFRGMLEPGLIGLTRRESFIAELASAWTSYVPAADRPPVAVAEASMAALWNSMSRAVDLGKASCLPKQAAFNSYRFLAPLVGPDRAAAIVAGEFSNGAPPRPLEAATSALPRGRLGGLGAPVLN